MKISKLPMFCRLLVGLIVFLGGIGVSSAIYYSGNSPAPNISEIAIIVLPSAAICIAAFFLARLFFETETGQTTGGIVGSAVLLITAAFIAASMTGDLSQLIAWLPVVLIFGAFSSAPMAAAAWFGVRLILGGGESTDSSGHSRPGE